MPICREDCMSARNCQLSFLHTGTKHKAGTKQKEGEAGRERHPLY